MQDLTIDAMGPRGRAVHEFGTMACETLATDPDLGLIQKLHTAFMYGFEAGLALQAMDPDWTRDAWSNWTPGKRASGAIKQRKLGRSSSRIPE